MAPLVAVASCSSLDGTLAGSITLSTVTGSNAEQGSFNSPRSNARRHLNTWLAFTPCAWATSATLAPDTNVNSTI